MTVEGQPKDVSLAGPAERANRYRGAPGRSTAQQAPRGGPARLRGGHLPATGL